MAHEDSFNTLAAGISPEERMTLLKRLSGQSTISEEPLYIGVEREDPDTATKEAYTALPWYYQLFCFVVGFFKGLSPDLVFQERQIARLGRDIEAQAPGIFDHRLRLLLPHFREALADLKDGARFFYNALDMSLNRDKGAFYSFLVSLEIPDVYLRLSTETAPKHILQTHPDAELLALRDIAISEMENAFTGITEDKRQLMAKHAQSLFYLKELACFLYDRILLSFATAPGEAGPACSVRTVKEQLSQLNNILYSFRSPPAMAIIQSLFVFILQDHADDEHFNMDLELRNLLVKADNAMVAIRAFNKQIPLTDILRCAYEQIGYSPQRISGGEDWFTVFQEYWRGQVESRFNSFLREQKHTEVLAAFRYFFKDAELKPLENAESETNPDGLAITGSFGLAFLQTFYRLVFLDDINPLLRVVMLEGDFFKRELRTAFTENYNNLIKLEEDIRQFDQNLSPSGKHGKRYAYVQGETSVQSRRRKMELTLEEASEEAQEIIMKARNSITAIIETLHAIIKKNADGKYETLANMAKLLKGNSLTNGMGKDVKPNPGSQAANKGTLFINAVVDGIQKLERTIKILDDIDLMETGF